MLRIVLDTNVLVSSLLAPKSTTAAVLDAWREHHYLLVTSPALISELRHTLSHSRIRQKYTFSDADIEQLIAALRTDALLVPGAADVGGSVPADPADEIVLACALDGTADLIVSGDRHLLELSTFRNIPIVRVRSFLDRLDPQQ